MVEETPPPLDGPHQSTNQTPLSPLRVLGQIANTYIVAESAEGMQLIDQHSAHESVLYYRLLAQWSEREPEVQPMLEPLPVELAPEQMDALAQTGEVLERYGITLEPFGDSTWLLRTVPAMARTVNGAKLVGDVLDAVTGSGDSVPDAHHAVAASIACHSAVRAGQPLGMQEMEALSSALVVESNPQHCPHGRPTTIRVTTSMLEREFGRT
jgi:DNA mismatch repair protein MutL